MKTSPQQRPHIQRKAQPGRRERRRAETRERIFRAAMRLFAENGFSETTTEQITDAADVGQGTFFNYFPTKPHVLTVLTEIQLSKIGVAISEAQAGKLPIGEVLHRLTYSITEEIGGSPELTRALLTAFLSNDEVRALTSKTMASAREQISGILTLGQQRGEVSDAVHAEHLALSFQRGIIGTMLLWAIGPKSNLRTWLEKAFCDFWSIAESRKG